MSVASALRRKRRILFFDLFLLLMTAIVYFQVVHCDFVNLDDDLYVTRNEMVGSGISIQGLKYAFTTGDVSNWHPTTWLSHMLVAQFFGLNPGAHHFAGFLLHLASTLLLFHVFLKMTRAPWQSAFVAALFAVHPFNVEAVSWVAERKGSLCTLFWMLTLWSYLRYMEQRRAGRYALVLTFFVLGCMAKPMIVTLPFALLLLDYWPLKRFSLDRPLKGETLSSLREAVLEKMPLMVLAFLMTVVGFFAQKGGGAITSLDVLPLTERISNALVSYVIYLYKAFWPQHLAAYYPLREYLLWQVIGALLILLFISTVAVLLRKQRPYFFVGWFWYLGTFLPVIQIVQIAIHAMADRYAYIPMIGIFIAAAWGVPEILKSFRYRKQITASMAGLTLLLLSMASWHQVRYWKNSTTLFEHALEAVPNNFFAHNQLGRALHNDGKVEAAVKHFEETLRIEPDYTDARYNLARSLASLGRTDEAVSYYQEALQRRPDLEEAHLNLGNILAQMGNVKAAVFHYTEALRIRPQYAGVHFNMGNVLAKEGRNKEAITHYEAALKIRPRHAQARYNLGNVLAKEGRTEDALVHYTEALRIDPTFLKARVNMGNLLSRQGKMDAAISSYRQALQFQPHHANANFNLARALSEQGKTDEAIGHYMKTLRNRPDHTHAHYYLANALSKKGRSDAAILHYQKALEAVPRFVEARINLGAELARQGKMEEALEQYDEAIRIHPGTRAYVYYNLACLYALKNSVKEAVGYLKKAVQSGFHDWEHMKSDRDLENIRSSPGYRELIKGL